MNERIYIILYMIISCGSSGSIGSTHDYVIVFLISCTIKTVPTRLFHSEWPESHAHDDDDALNNNKIGTTERPTI